LCISVRNWLMLCWPKGLLEQYISLFLLTNECSHMIHKMWEIGLDVLYLSFASCCYSIEIEWRQRHYCTALLQLFVYRASTYIYTSVRCHCQCFELYGLASFLTYRKGRDASFRSTILGQRYSRKNPQKSVRPGFLNMHAFQSHRRILVNVCMLKKSLNKRY
jgi:hypothetical protein